MGKSHWMMANVHMGRRLCGRQASLWAVIILAYRHHDLLPRASAFSSPELKSPWTRLNSVRRASPVSEGTTLLNMFRLPGNIFPLRVLSSSETEYSFLDESIGPTLSYLRDDGDYLPPETRQLVERATKAYIHDSRPQGRCLSREDIESALEHEYVSADVPVKVGNITFDVGVSREDDDEFIVDILSLGAIQQLPEEIVTELLTATAAPESRAWLTRDLYENCGWAGVSFPKGVALRLKPQAGGSRAGFRSWLRSNKVRAEEAEALVEMARTVRAPIRLVKSRAELLASMEVQLEPTITRRGDDLPFFPRKTLSMKRMRRSVRRRAELLQSKGRAGIVAYCFLNFCLYTAGWWWQWRSIYPVDPQVTSSAVTLCARKVSRVFGSLLLLSQMLKIPKLIASVALAPAAENALNVTKTKLQVSENVSSAVLIGGLVAIWAACVAVAFVGDFTRLKRLIHLERALQGYELQPA